MAKQATKKATKKSSPKKKDGVFLVNFEQEMTILDAAIKTNQAPLLIGPPATGKNTLIYKIANDRGTKVHRFSITGETTTDDFVGKMTLVNGETIWQDGVLLSAMKNGDWLVVDEINAAAAEILFILHSVMDDDRSVMLAQNDGEVIKAHKDFRLFATMNPTSTHAGTKELNGALLSRFGLVLDIVEPEDWAIKAILEEKAPGCSADKLVYLFNDLKKAHEDMRIQYRVTLRDIIHAAQIEADVSFDTAITVAIVYKAMEEKDAVAQIVGASINKKRDAIPTKAQIDKLLDKEKQAKVNIEAAESQLKSLKDLTTGLDQLLDFAGSISEWNWSLENFLTSINQLDLDSKTCAVTVADITQYYNTLRDLLSGAKNICDTTILATDRAALITRLTDVSKYLNTLAV